MTIETVDAVRGDVYTRRWVVETILTLTGFTADRDLANLTIVEPSAGDGAFLGPIVERLLESVRLHGRPVSDLSDSLVAYELYEDAAAQARQILRTLLAEGGVGEDQARDLALRWVRTADYLLDEQELTADFVVGNPPYIRLEEIDNKVGAAYRTRWWTMTARADIYVGFIEKALKSLRAGGRLGFIVADRWMRNQYGAKLRELVSTGGYAVEQVWTMHDVDAFVSPVSAYPAITVIRKGEQDAAVVIDTTSDFGEESAAAATAWAMGATAGERFATSGAQGAALETWFTDEPSWPNGTPESLKLIAHLNQYPGLRPIHDPSHCTTVTIGIATGADKIFITKNSDLVEQDRLVPLAKSRDISTGSLIWGGTYLVDPWAERGRLVDLSKYPLLRSHFESHRADLVKRHTAKRDLSRYYKTIDPMHHDRIKLPKLLFTDMKTQLTPVLEPGGLYPHHNLYYVISDVWDLEVLGGLMMTQMAQEYLAAHTVKMRGGTLRAQAQYLKRIPVPSPNEIPDKAAAALRQAFREGDRTEATRVARPLYGLSAKEWDWVDQISG
ncbi:Eco57I restriction-modification methylase domain-containing protein [Brevibacterium sp. FAM 24638]|uniref:Eco57I restriction-modification methylase domain-containing protein n=1 Tax=Brevibacterium sp. FAM 24638 TaxID=3415681 RepID=UPI003C7E1D36